MGVAHGHMGEQQASRARHGVSVCYGWAWHSLIPEASLLCFLQSQTVDEYSKAATTPKHLLSYRRSRKGRPASASHALRRHKSEAGYTRSRRETASQKKSVDDLDSSSSVSARMSALGRHASALGRHASQRGISREVARQLSVRSRRRSSTPEKQLQEQHEESDEEDIPEVCCMLFVLFSGC